MENAKAYFDIINNHMNTIGWKVQSDEVDEAIGHLSPAQIVAAADDVLHADLFAYLSTYHQTWLFETSWAWEDAEDCPDNYDPTIPLNKVPLWAIGDRV